MKLTKAENAKIPEGFYMYEIVGPLNQSFRTEDVIEATAFIHVKASARGGKNPPSFSIYGIKNNRSKIIGATVKGFYLTPEQFHKYLDLSDESQIRKFLENENL